mgnify:CR=1 FL=1
MPAINIEKNAIHWKFELRGSFKKYVDFYRNFFSRRHITLRFGTHIWTTNSVDLKEKF